MLIQKFWEIIAWRKAHELVLKVYELTKKLPESEKFALLSQMRRAAISVPANIAEGFKRKGKKDSLHFYNIAQGSLEELKYYFMLCQDLKYITSEEYTVIAEQADETSKVLQGWINCQK